MFRETQGVVKAVNPVDLLTSLTNVFKNGSYEEKKEALFAYMDFINASGVFHAAHMHTLEQEYKPRCEVLTEYIKSKTQP